MKSLLVYLTKKLTAGSIEKLKLTKIKSNIKKEIIVGIQKLISLFVEELSKIIKQINVFVGYAECWSMNTVVLKKPTLFVNNIAPSV